MVGMLILSFVLGYPMFMVFAYFVAKTIFTPLDKIAEEQQREKAMLLMRAQRIRRTQRLAHA